MNFSNIFIVIICLSLVSCANQKKVNTSKGNTQSVSEIFKNKNNIIYKRNDGTLEEFYFNYKADTVQERIKGFPGEFLDRVLISCFTVRFYPSGMLQWTGKYCKGEKCGEWNYYNKDGALDSIICYDSLAVKRTIIKH